MDKIKEAQWLLYKWMGCFEKRKEGSIKKQCESLNENLKLGITTSPIWVLFFPMVYSGVADFVGNGYYALTSSIAIECGDHLYGVNDIFNCPTKLPVGFSLIDKNNSSTDIKIVKTDPLSVLKAIPSLQEVVENWPNEIVSTKSLKFLNKKGLAVLEERFKRYFCIPEENYIKSVPPRDVNPEAYNIAYCYTKVINNQVIGVYDKNEKMLKVDSFAFPIMLYRILMLEGLKSEMFPKQGMGCLYFFNVSFLIIDELNRILDSSIVYGKIDVDLNEKSFAEYPQQTPISSEVKSFFDVDFNCQFEDNTAKTLQNGLPYIETVEDHIMDSIQEADDKFQVKQMLAKELGQGLLNVKDPDGHNLAKRNTEIQPSYSDPEVVELIIAKAKQIVKNKMRWAARTSEAIDAQEAYGLINDIVAQLTISKCPKGTICVPCATYNSVLPNICFIFKERGGRLKVGFERRPTYSMYRKMNRLGVRSGGLWTLGLGVGSPELEKAFGKQWAARYIKG